MADSITQLLSPYIVETGYLSHQIVRRAAFDIGSGLIRMQISDVDLSMNTIASVLLTESIKVALREDLINGLDGKLSVDIQDQMINAILNLLEKAAPFNPENYCAIATEAFRLAENADAIIERIKMETGLSVTIISQNEEGILGFLSAVSEINGDPHHSVSWDIGGGSFQVTTKKENRYLVYQEQLGATVFLKSLLKIQGKNQSSPNPISKGDVKRALKFIKENMKELPFEFRHKLNDSEVTVLGMGINPLWYKQENLFFTKDLLFKELELQLDFDDDDIRINNKISSMESSFHVVSNLILTYGIMDCLDIYRVRYVGTKSANAVGLLLSPEYWQNYQFNGMKLTGWTG